MIDCGLGLFFKAKIDLRLVFSTEKMVVVRKHCDFWIKVFKKLSFLITEINKNQGFTVLQIKEKRHRLTNERVSTMKNILEYLELFKLFDKFVQNHKADDQAIKDAKMVATSVPKGINFFDAKHNVMLTTVFVSFMIIMLLSNSLTNHCRCA